MSKPQFAAVTRQSAADQVYRALREKIEDGSLAPGEQLADGELAQALGVSRTPVREALRRLVDQGVVETMPGRHTRVAEAGEAQAHQVLPLLSLLHGFATESATEMLDAADLAEMTDCNERMRVAAEAGDSAAARAADQQFHAVLVRRAENPYLAMLVDVLSLHSRRLEALYFQDKDPASGSYAQHQEIIEAIRRKDKEAACALVRENTRRGPGEP